MTDNFRRYEELINLNGGLPDNNEHGNLDKYYVIDVDAARQMKPNELMIGDWLQYKGQYNAFTFRVEQITKRKVGYHAEPGEFRIHYLRLCECQPIAITEEILERNGFERKVEYEKYEWCEGNVELWVILDAPFVGEEKNHVIHIDAMRSAAIPVTYHDTIKYVHELQHILRLCKIEKEIVIH